jgi:1,4-alpha-glucan branching enzyme
VFAVDTELLGHWWYEGLQWLAAVVDECSRQGLELVRLDDALEPHEPAPAAIGGDAWQASSWGKDGDLSTWSGAAVRELLALQASDWPFMVSRGVAVPYARERFDGHRAAFARARSSGREDAAGLRNLAAFADRTALLSP